MAYTEYIFPLPPNFAAGASGARIGYTPQNDRQAIGDLLSAGVISAPTTITGDFAVTWASGMMVAIAAGSAYVPGLNVTNQGLYRVLKSSLQNLTIGTADATKPRIDQIVIRVFDHEMDASNKWEARVQVIPGTATTGATLDNRTGAANLTTLTEGSKSVLLLADVLVPAGATVLDAAKVRDQRMVIGGVWTPYTPLAIVGWGTPDYSRFQFRYNAPKGLDIKFYVEGTSNNSYTSFLIPSPYYAHLGSSVYPIQSAIYAIDNSVAGVGYANWASGDGSIDLSFGYNLSWTATGYKRVAGVITISLA